MNINERLHLKWNDHSNSILQVLLQYLVADRMVDVTLSCQGQFIKAHKLVLSACSPYFEELFRVHNQNDIVVIINSVSVRHLLLVIEYIYTGEVDIMEQELHEFLQVAEELQIKSLNDVLPKVNYKLPLEFFVNYANSNIISKDALQNESNIVSHPKTNMPVLSTPLRKTVEDTKSTIEENNNNVLLKTPVQEDTTQKKTPKESKKIPRPPNAFMVFANQWRRKLANEHKDENNKEISIRLGLMWKNMNDDQKAQYYKESRRVDEQHKIKYPGYYYSPIEARKRKKRKLERSQSQTLSSDTESPPQIMRDSNEISPIVMEQCESTESADDIKIKSPYRPELSDVINAIIGTGVTNCIIENNNVVTRAEIEPAIFVKDEIINEDSSSN